MLRLSGCHYVRLSVRLSVQLSVSTYIRTYACLSDCLCIWMYVHLSFSLYVQKYIYFQHLALCFNKPGPPLVKEGNLAHRWSHYLWWEISVSPILPQSEKLAPYLLLTIIGNRLSEIPATLLLSLGSHIWLPASQNTLNHQYNLTFWSKILQKQSFLIKLLTRYNSKAFCEKKI